MIHNNELYREPREGREGETRKSVIKKFNSKNAILSLIALFSWVQLPLKASNYLFASPSSCHFIFSNFLFKKPPLHFFKTPLSCFLEFTSYPKLLFLLTIHVPLFSKHTHIHTPLCYFYIQDFSIPKPSKLKWGEEERSQVHMGRHSCCYKQKLRKGLWSPEEDEKLLNYITKHGHGCWSSVPKLAGNHTASSFSFVTFFIFKSHFNLSFSVIVYNTGLQRCGKSCRLRWINYLRPDLKRGAFSQQEENLIIELHAVLGNRYKTQLNSRVWFKHVLFGF